MIRLTTAWLAMVVFSGLGSVSRADDKDATPVLDKAIEALGGLEKVTKATSSTWKGTGTVTFNGGENPIKTVTTVQGIDRHRAEFSGDFNGNEVKGVTILDGDKGWRKFNDDLQDLEGDFLSMEKHRAYLQAAVMTIVPIKGKGFKAELAADEKVDGKPVSVVKVVGPDSKKFTLSFDKETGLPVKQTATIKGFTGEEVSEETMLSDYKDFNGVKRATKMASKRDGDPFIKMELSGFQILEKPSAETFAEPK